jgi:hypothetical protein
MPKSKSDRLTIKRILNGTSLAELAKKTLLPAGKAVSICRIAGMVNRVKYNPLADNCEFFGVFKAINLLTGGIHTGRSVMLPPSHEREVLTAYEHLGGGILDMAIELGMLCTEPARGANPPKIEFMHGVTPPYFHESFCVDSIIARAPGFQKLPAAIAAPKKKPTRPFTLAEREQIRKAAIIRPRAPSKPMARFVSRRNP